MHLKIGKDFIPLGIAIALALISAAVIIFSNIIVGTKFHLGIASLLVSVILYFFHRKSFRYFFLTVLGFAVFNLVEFLFITFNFSILGINFNLIAIFLIILFLYIQRHLIEDRFETSTEEKEIKSKGKLAAFKKRYEKLSDDEILDLPLEKLVPEARKALDAIKRERGLL